MGLWAGVSGLSFQGATGGENWESENLTDLTTRRRGYSWESLEEHGEVTGRRVRRVKASASRVGQVFHIHSLILMMYTISLLFELD